MKFIAFSLSLFTTMHMATAKQFPPAGNEFIAAGDDDIRSPCPAINTLANHGFINRDGRNIDVRDLAQALEDIYRVSGDTLIGAPIASAIRLGLTVETDGQNFLTIDRLFDGLGNGDASEAQEHDSSFVREDFSSGADARAPSPRLIEAFFESTSRAILSPADVMEYQRGRIMESCNADTGRKYTTGHRGGMSIQGALLFAIAQTQGPNFNHANKANLRSVFEGEILPHNYNPFNIKRIFAFDDESNSDNLRDEFRENVDKAICDCCNLDDYTEEDNLGCDSRPSDVCV